MYNKYIFDASPLIDLFKHYYPERFPSLWKDFNTMVKDGQLMSVREVSKELEARDDDLTKWTKQNPDLFTQSHVNELKIVANIFTNKHFQLIVRNKEILSGKPVADPFIVARAKYLDAYVVTNEKYTDDNAAKLPNLCNSLDVKYINLKQFMELENWIF